MAVPHKSLAVKSTKSTITSKIPPALAAIRGRLYYEGFKRVELLPGRATELIVDGARVGIKIASPNSKGQWYVNIARHGELNERGIDAYLIVLQKPPGNSFKSLMLIFKAPVGRVGYQFSFYSITRLYAAHVEDWPTLKAICKEKSAAKTA